MTEYASFDDLTAGNLEDDAEDLTLPSGLVVRVRGLSRYDLHFGGKGTDDPRVVEVRNVVACLIEPKLTVAQVEQWQRRSAAGADFRVLTERIRDLSGLGEGADKSDLRHDGEQS